MRRERERKEEEEEEEEKKSKQSQAPKRYGTTWVFKTWNGFPCNCIVICCTQT